MESFTQTYILAYLIGAVGMTTASSCSSLLSDISNSAFEASSSMAPSSPSDARWDGHSPTAWYPDQNDSSSYLQISFSKPSRIENITTTGDHSSSAYAATYSLEYSFDKQIWMRYSELSSGINKVFTSSVDSTSQQQNSLSALGQHVRLKVQCPPNDECALKLDIQGCHCTTGNGISHSTISDVEVTNMNENFVYLHSTTSTVLEFSYVKSGGSDLEVVASLDTGDTLIGDVDTNANTAKVYVKSEDFPDLGTYLLSTEIKPCVGTSHTKEMVVYHEEQIENFQVTTETGYFVPIAEDVEFLVTMTSGSNVQMEWMIDHNYTTCLYDYPGRVRNISKTFTFYENRSYNMTAFARNYLKPVYKIMTITALRRVSNFTVITAGGLLSTREEFYVKVSNTLRLSELNEMGDVYLDIIYGTGDTKSLKINSDFGLIINNSNSYMAKYMIQGNYTLTARIRNEIDYQDFEFLFYIWDTLNVSLTSLPYVTIGEPFLFTFENPPLAAFQYKIDYGNGLLFETNESIWYQNLSTRSWNDYNYTFPGVFDLLIVMWNPFNVIVQNYTLTAQHPIPSMTIYPTDGDFPSPNNRAYFDLTMDEEKPSPTNVTCIFNHDGQIEIKEHVVFVYSIVYKRTFEYNKPGYKNVTINCFNLVSTMQKFSYINIRTYDISDFEVLYPHEVPMNMSATGNGTDFENNPLGIYDIPVEVTFKTKLYNMVVMPNDLRFKWDFDDGPALITEDVREFEQSHVFSTRRLHECVLTVTNKLYKDVEVDIDIAIKLGITNFTADMYDGRPAKDTFMFTASGVDGTVQYDINLDDTQGSRKITLSGGIAKISTLYPVRGQFLPELLVTNGSFTEFLHTTRHIGIDFVFNGINWTMSSVVPLPTGEVAVIFAVPDDGDPVLDITCSFTSGDRIDKAIHYQMTNLSISNPIIFNYTYLTLGNHEFSSKCANYNSKDSWKNSTNVLVYNYCYSINGVFDRQYSNKTTPMIVLTSKDVDLASRMLVYCPEKGPHYEWRYFNVSLDDDSKVEFFYNPAFVPTGSVRFSKGTLPEGLYQVSLNVSLEDTWIQEYTFIRFKKPPPYAFIVKGSHRIAAIAVKELLIDGLTESYDAQYGYGNNQYLEFTWYCNRVDTKLIDELDDLYTSYGGYEYFKDNMPKPCNESLRVSSESEGKVILNITTTTETGYIVTMRVTKDGYESHYTQLIQSVIGNPPDISIICTINCLEKYSITSPLSVKVECSDCNDPHDIAYKWYLRRLDNGTYIEENLDNITLTDTTYSNLVIKPDMLEEGGKYVLSVNVSALGREMAIGVKHIKANYAPYNGTCYADPVIGNASTTPFGVYCPGWMDEGTSSFRSQLRDMKEKEPLVYEYIAYIKLPDEGFSQVPLFKGSESTATELPLPVGYQDANYEMEIEVRIYDRFGHFVIFRGPETTVQVFPDQEMVPSDLNDTSSINTLFDTFDKAYNITEAGGNSMAMVRLVGATTSIYLSAGLKETETTSSPDADLLSGNIDLETVELETPLTPVQMSLQSKTRKFTEILLSAATPKASDDADSTEEESAISAADVRQVARSLSSCISNPLFVDDISIENAATGTEKLMHNIRLVSSVKPFPIEDINNIEDASDGVIEAVDKIFAMLLPEEVSEVVPTLETVQAEIENYVFYDGQNSAISQMSTEDRTEYAKKLLNVKLKKREKQLKKQENVQKNLPKMKSALHDTLLSKSKIVQIGTGVNTVTKPNVELSVEKESGDAFVNKTVERSNVKLSLDIDKLPNSADEVELWVTSFKKEPYIYASGASAITSAAINITTRDKDENHLNLPRTIKLSNNREAFFKHYYAGNISDGIDPMFYFLIDKSSSDAVIVYIKPDDVLLTDLEENDMYTVYMTVGDYPTSSSYTYSRSIEVRDWEEPYGFKTFVPNGILGAGRIYIGLKPKNIEVSNSASRRRRRRSTSNGNSTLPSFNPKVSNFSIAIVTTGCRSYKESTNEWVDTGCQVLELSTINETICRCTDTPGNTLASTFYVPPNTIDFHAVWSKFDATNAAVYGTIIALLVIYFIAIPWFRRQDKRDISKWATMFLCDSEMTDSYFYLLSVQTGLRREAGTTSNVSFIIGAEDGDSGVRILSDGFTKGFEAGSIRTFLMGTPVPLGELTYFRVWHDSSGTGNMKSWYLHKVMVDDLQTKRRYIFMCDRWLAVEQDDGMIERVLPVSSKDALKSYDQLISQHARFNATENHLWLSMLIRPQKSNFTRVQRLSCGLALLFLTMIANAMFYKDAPSVQPSQVTIGILSFSLTSLYTSFMSILIATIPMIFITLIFKKSRSSPKADPQKNIENNFIEKIKKKNAQKNEVEAAMKQDEHYVEFIKESRQPLPHWMVYIGWILLALAVLTSAFFLILYSMEWGKSKSETWLSTFFFSFLESLFVMDPLNVILMAVLVALIFRKPVDGDSPEVEMSKIKEAATKFGTDPSRSYLTFRMQVLSKQGPPTENMLEGERKQREAEVKAQAVFRRLIIYAIFVFVVFSISYINRDARSFRLKSSLDGQLLESSTFTLGFQDVNSTKGLLYWLEHTLFPLYFPETYYNGDPLPVLDKLYFADMENVRVGPARLRQVRMKKVQCSYVIDAAHACVEDYHEDEEDTGNFCYGWEPFNSSCPLNAARFTQDGWSYKTSKETYGLSYIGQRSIYGGGGYVVTFDINLANSLSILRELSTYSWIDRQTRAVFFEFTLYNPNINLFLSAIYLAEYVDTGGMLTWIDLQSFRPYQALNAVGTYAIICYFIYFIFLISGIIKMILQIRKEGKSYFKKPWNVIDVISAILGLIAIVLWALRLKYSNDVLDRYYESKTTFVTFQHVVYWDNAFVIVMAILTFIATIRILQILGYNRRMTQLIEVIVGAGADLMSFALVFGIVYSAYVIGGYLLFGANVKGYRSIFVAFGSLTNSIIGKNHLEIITSAGPVLAEVYYFSYILIVILIMISMFAVILNQSISAVKEEIQDENVYGLTNVIADSFKDIFGSVFSFTNKDKKENKNQIAPKYETLSTRKPDFDAPNIVDLLQEILKQHGGTPSDKTDVPKITIERETPQPLDLTMELPDERQRPKSAKSINSTDDVELCFDERNSKKVSNMSVFL